jgi:hypothetical protein
VVQATEAATNIIMEAADATQGWLDGGPGGGQLEGMIPDGVPQVGRRVAGCRDAAHSG